MGLLEVFGVEFGLGVWRLAMVMKWKKAPPELVDFLAEKMRGVKCEFRKMFGYPAYFINGNMFVGIHGDSLFIRLSKPDIEEIRKTRCTVLRLSSSRRNQPF
ncbi:MAG: TfoX/Sxy family protein [Candidatus Atabeyarchaeum deiterrae]